MSFLISFCLQWIAIAWPWNDGTLRTPTRNLALPSLENPVLTFEVVKKMGQRLHEPIKRRNHATFWPSFQPSLDEGEGLVSVVGDGVGLVQLQLEEVTHRTVLTLKRRWLKSVINVIYHINFLFLDLEFMRSCHLLDIDLIISWSNILI